MRQKLINSGWLSRVFGFLQQVFIILTIGGLFALIALHSQFSADRSSSMGPETGVPTSESYLSISKPEDKIFGHRPGGELIRKGGGE